MIQMAWQKLHAAHRRKEDVSMSPDFGCVAWKETMEEVLKGSVLKHKFDEL